MNMTQKSLITFLVFFIASCSSVSMDRTNDATAISTSASDAYSDSGLTSNNICLLYTSPSPRDKRQSRMPSSA